MKKLLLASTLLALSSASFAETAAEASPNWKFVEASYVSSTFDDDEDDIDASGYALKSSTTLGDNFLVTASYNTVSDEMNMYGYDVEITLSQLSVGLGYKYNISQATDIYGIVSYRGYVAEVEAGGAKEDADESGYGIELGAKTMLTPNLEVGGGLDYTSVDGETDTGLVGTINYAFTTSFSIGAGVTTSSDITSVLATLRLSF